MRLGPARIALWAAPLLLLLAIPAATAAPGTVQGSAALPLQADGTASASSPDGYLVASGDAGDLRFTLTGEGSVTRVVHRAFGIVASDDPRAEVLWYDDVDRQRLDLDGSTLELRTRLPGFQMLAQGGSTESRTTDTLLVGLLDEPRILGHTLEPDIALHLNPPSDADAYQRILPAGLLDARILDGTATASGDLHLFVADAELELLGPKGRTAIAAHYRTEQRPGALFNPLSGEWFGEGSHEERVQEYLVVDATQATLRLDVSGVPTSVLARSATAHVQGGVLLPAMTGIVTVDGEDGPERHVVSGQDMRLAGDVVLSVSEARLREGRAPVAGHGDITSVSYGGVQADYPWGTIAAAVGLGAVALAVGAWLATQGKTLLAGGAAVAGYARVHGNGVLEHPGRQEVYDRVKANPGISFMEMARQVSFGESTLNYHLRVLAKNEFVTPVKDGRHLRFFDRKDGHYSADRKVAVSALRNPTTAAIAREILARPGIPQCDLASRFGIAPSTVNWHIRRLQAVGLVDPRRDHPHTRYYAGGAWATIPAGEQTRLPPVPAVAVAVTAG